MIRGMFQNSSDFTKLVITLSVSFLLIFISSFFAVSIGVSLYNIDLNNTGNIMNDLNDPRNVAVLKFSQIIVSLAGFVFAALLLAYLFSFNTNQFLQLDRYPGVKFSLAAVLLVFVIFPVVNLIAALNSEIHLPEFLGGVERYLNEQDRMNEQIMETFLADTNLQGLFVNIVMIGIIPAVGEELFFRGVVQQIFSKMTRNHHWGIWITAIIFSLIHMQFSGFFPRVFLGAMFGYLLVWSGSMWVPILAHFINNLAAVVMYYFVNTGKLTRETLEYGSTMDVLPVVLVSAFVSGGLLWYFYRNSDKTDRPIDISEDQEP